MRREPFRNQMDLDGGAKLRRPTRKTVQTQRQVSRILLHCHVYYSGINVQGEGAIRNLSLRGCQIDGSVDVRPGTKLCLVLTLPSPYSPVVVDRSIVVWSDGNWFGLRHELLLPTDRIQLEKILDGSDTTAQLLNSRATSLSA